MAEISIDKMTKNIVEKVIQELRDNGVFVSSWIPVSEGLPKENEVVIASTKYGVYPEARYIEEYGWEWAYEAGADYWKELEGVTAWMPLPKTYNPQSEGKAKDLSKRVEDLETQMKEDREERLKKLQADLDYAKFCCALPTIR